ncbi:hypothetical protein AKJ09_03103 [Labilithrix luteola]|uniref:IgGFc-binding protein N-terminal domain-containing protein n=1 Tax=Labilithrix luteola TaxID=1391654 RepID=A0A0K1PTI0_9BACT|nr:IgGFc-binding protein [Labilithrix luteola]AKU96439.1 hypothetical protein AKJ09_03103 [Labilithrix luteola]
MKLSDRLLRVSFLALGVTGALVVMAACSSSSNSTSRAFDTPQEPSIVSDASAEEEPKCGPHCSRDLKQVLTGCGADEVVTETCDQDKGCGDGRCVDACASAAISKGSTGCDFYTLPPTDVIEMAGSCFAAIVANTWDRPVSLSAEYGGETLDISKSVYTVTKTAGADVDYKLLDGPLPVGEVGIVFLANDLKNNGKDRTYCPLSVTPALPIDPIIHGTAKTKAFHIKTDAPVSAYSIFPYGGADTHVPTATLLLPVSSWDLDYVAVSPNYFGDPRKRRTLQIVANENDTEISMRPNGEVKASGDVTGATAGITQTWTLQKGQVLQILQDALTGSPIHANKPVALFGGSECTFIPSTIDYCDALQQQIPAVSQWGTEYAVVPYPTRVETFQGPLNENVPYTIVAAADGTKFTYDPAPPRGAPDVLNAGESASFMTDQVFVAKSQDDKHPFHVNVYMTSSQYGGGVGTAMTTGDPDYVNVPAADQFLDHYVFFTDFTYPETRLTVVRRRTANGFAPVTLECAGEIDSWQPLGKGGEYEYAYLKLTTGFQDQKFAGGTCTYGRQEAKSDGPFAITVWGMAQDSSYAYVGGTGLRPINNATPPTIK